ncbi:hypothetical protein [Pseudoalteromonas nigrifaciens]|uniref:hypothetical protein n=1 Tax=Pseudoalteromonas nigrifaciens TaxID=28109 RepID=UPI003FD4ADBD
MCVIVKNFGNDISCSNLDSLKAILRDNYTCKSVSILNNGKLIFVDVSANGDLKDTYKGNTISFDDFKFAESKIKY